MAGMVLPIAVKWCGVGMYRCTDKTCITRFIGGPLRLGREALLSPESTIEDPNTKRARSSFFSPSSSSSPSSRKVPRASLIRASLFTAEAVNTGCVTVARLGDGATAAAAASTDGAGAVAAAAAAVAEVGADAGAEEAGAESSGRERDMGTDAAAPRSCCCCCRFSERARRARRLGEAMAAMGESVARRDGAGSTLVITTSPESSDFPLPSRRNTPLLDIVVDADG